LLVLLLALGDRPARLEPVCYVDGVAVTEAQFDAFEARLVAQPGSAERAPRAGSARYVAHDASGIPYFVSRGSGSRSIEGQYSVQFHAVSKREFDAFLATLRGRDEEIEAETPRGGETTFTAYDDHGVGYGVQLGTNEPSKIFRNGRSRAAARSGTGRPAGP